jgi:hypothetical protein
MNLSPVPSLKTLDNEKTAANLKALFQDAQEGVKRIAYFGFLALHVKTVELEHGQFLPWMAAYCPELSRQTVASHIQLARTVLQAMAIRPWKIRSNVKQLDISHYGELLSIAEKDLNDAAKSSRQKMLEIIEGKSARQLLAKYKQAAAEPPEPKVQQLYGQSQAAPREWGKDRLTALQEEIEHWAAWADRHVSLKELTEVSGRHQELLGRLHALLDDYLRQYSAYLARASGQG